MIASRCMHVGITKLWLVSVIACYCIYVIHNIPGSEGARGDYISYEIRSVECQLKRGRITGNLLVSHPWEFWGSNKPSSIMGSSVDRCFRRPKKQHDRTTANGSDVFLFVSGENCSVDVGVSRMPFQKCMYWTRCVQALCALIDFLKSSLDCLPTWNGVCNLLKGLDDHPTC